MKTSGKTKLRNVLLLITAVALVSIFSANAQNPSFDRVTPINQTFTTSTEIYPFSGIQMYGAGVDGNITITSDNSIVKIILKDSVNMDYLIYESNSLLNQDLVHNFNEECEETCFFEGFTPTSIEIQIVGATLTLNNFKFSSSGLLDAAVLQQQARNAKISQKIDLVNQYIQQEGFIWVAGQTSYLGMYYNAKKDLYKSSIWHPAIEYYTAGFFSLKSIMNGANITVNYDYVDNFEWRNRHGANDLNSPYYDGNADGSGWLTEAACQDGCWTNGILDCSVFEWQCGAGSEWRSVGTCWAFGPTSHVEALVNLYLNQHYDVDLSEQNIVSCSYYEPWPGPGNHYWAYDYFQNNGVVNEDCFPYTAQGTPCDEMCQLPDEKIIISSYNGLMHPPQQILRETIINDGPVGAAYMNCMIGEWTHTMQLVGWDIIEWEDREDCSIYGIPPNPEVFSDYVGCTYWIYKQNYGNRDDMNGFSYMIHENDDTPYIFSIPTNTQNFVSSVLNTFDETDIACLDKDLDGYFNWGIGPKPAHCPPCPDLPDGDDNDPGLGPLDEHGFCTIIGTYNSDFEKTMCNWKQSADDDCDWMRYSGETPNPFTGPSDTPDGSDFYIYADASFCYLRAAAFLESPTILLPEACAIEMTFAYHKENYTYGNDDTDNSRLAVDISYDHGLTWDTSYWSVIGNQGDIWHYETLTFPSNINKLRFRTYTGIHTFFNDIALDDITIGPAENNITVISVPTIWKDQSYALCNDVIVESGATLTLTNATLYMGSGARIIVKDNAQLLINNSTITTNGYDTWQGIEVWGNPEATQIPANQGWVSINTGSIIKNAVVGVRVGSASYSGKGGGIVSTHEAVFRNNRSGAIIHDYAGRNISNFNLTTFETTAGLVDNSLPDEHLRLIGVSGVRISGCTFRNTLSSELSHNERGTGILSFDASYLVDHICVSGTVPCTEYQKTVFDSLNYGVKAFAISTTMAPTVKNSEFTSNYRGAYLSGITNARITSNNFYLNLTEASENYGLYLDVCDQYWVEDNHFESSIPPTKTGIGIYVNESGSQPNEIYLNSFNYVEYAVVALGKNRDGRNPATGLEIRCNNYDNTIFDEVVVYDSPINNPPKDNGIAALQGRNTLEIEDMAGNLFYYNTKVSGDFDDINNQSNHFYYYYSSNAGIFNVEPIDYTTNTVTKVAKNTLNWDYEVACPSGISSGGGAVIDGDYSDMHEAQTEIENTEALLMALVDGGDTETLNTEVVTSTPPEAEALYNHLMAESPNLSETVVETSIEKEDVLPNAMLRDVMVANPHTSTSLQLLEKLDDRSNPMPEYMKAQILAGRSIQSLKSELEGQLAGHKMRKVRAMNSIARYFIDTLEMADTYDSLAALYQSDNTLNSRYMLAWLYLQSGQYLQGQNVMSALPSWFTLTEDDLAEYQDLQSLYTMLREIYEGGETLNELSTSQIGQFVSIALAETGLAAVYARNILINIIDFEYSEPVTLPDQLKSTMTEEAYNKLLSSPLPKMLELYPNPSKDFVFLGYQFERNTRGVIEIRDVLGKLIYNIPFEGMQDQITILTKTWTPGIYFVNLVVNEKVTETTKFTLIN